MSDNGLDTHTKPDPLASDPAVPDEDPVVLSDNDEPIKDAGAEPDAHDSDDALSEIDENQFEDYDPETADIEDRPVVVDEDIAKTLKASRRKRTDAEPRKPKEARREKKRGRDNDDGGDFSDGHGATRKSRRGGERQKKATPEPENEDHLSPEERRQRAIERALDAALKKPKMKRKRKGEDDLEDEIDDEIAELKIAMERACEYDNKARESGVPAMRKIQLLPKVVGLLNRTSVQDAVLDPDTNFLQHVKFFLEPLNDGSLPAYNIQRDIFKALVTLPIEKEVLLSSGIGKVVLFYTQSKRPEIQIKRMAERLVGEWSRPLLKRTDDYRKRRIETREFDYDALKATQRTGSQMTLTQRPSTQSARQAERDRILAQKSNSNRARPGGLPDSYSIAPVSTFDPRTAPDHRPIGASGAEAFRRMTAKAKKR
ncbi:transcription factor IWS1 [Plectosphaerella plurivora]|uniref:Transcription factor IWS1 n=1 Tax=Plectosphaerella plurivora TaxID=936078 RepID=A0A9P8VNB4_9PEZI|nr:transcription factor IWS1 [Plectosphaerella plurivora]